MKFSYDFFEVTNQVLFIFCLIKRYMVLIFKKAEFMHSKKSFRIKVVAKNLFSSNFSEISIPVK